MYLGGDIYEVNLGTLVLEIPMDILNLFSGLFKLNSTSKLLLQSYSFCFVIYSIWLPSSRKQSDHVFYSLI